MVFSMLPELLVTHLGIKIINPRFPMLIITTFLNVINDYIDNIEGG